MANRKDAPPSVLTRSGRKTSTGIQASTNPLNTRKSPRFEKQMGQILSTDKKNPEKSENLWRSERGSKNPVDVPTSNLSTEKSVDVSEESAEDGSRDQNGGSKKRKRYHAVEFKARNKTQRLRVETEGSEVLAHIESPSSYGDQFWSAADGNANCLYQHLKPTDSAADASNVVEAGNDTTPSDMAQLDDHCEMNMPSVNDVAPNVDSADGSHGIQDPANETGLYGMSPHVDSDETGMLDDIDMAPNDYSADMSHAVEDPYNNGSNDISLHAESDQMGIPAANDLTPHMEYADGSHAVEDPNGTGPNYVAPNVESVEKAHDTTHSVQQVASPVSDHSMPAIPEVHNDSHLLQQPSENGVQDQEGQANPAPMIEIEDDNTQPVEAIQVDHIIPEDSSFNPHDEPSSVMSANPTVTENQAAMLLPTSEVLAQTTAAQTLIQNASLLEQYLFDLQRNANSNQMGSQMTHLVDPLHIELEQLFSLKEKMVKSYYDNIQKINIDCEEETAETIAGIRSKYCNKRQEADATFNSQKNEVENNMNTLVINQVLAETFRHKRQLASRDCAALQQACQAESMQQQHRFRGPLTCLPSQFSGTQQAPTPIPATAIATQLPLQVVHQSSAHFLTPLTRHPHATNLRPASTTPITPPPNTETCGQSLQSQHLVSSVSRSMAPHMRPLVSREIQTPGPHMQPAGSGTYDRALPVQHVTSSVPLTSPSNSQQLNSTSPVQPLLPLPRKHLPVTPPPQPHASVVISAHLSLPRGPSSVPQNRGPKDKLNDNVKTLNYNAGRVLNVLDTPEFLGGGNAAQPPSAHEVVYLSDDD